MAIDTDFLIRLAIEEHPGRPVSEAVRARHLDAGDRFALAPQVIAADYAIFPGLRLIELR